MSTAIMQVPLAARNQKALVYQPAAMSPKSTLTLAVTTSSVRRLNCSQRRFGFGVVVGVVVID
jgi:hypothetical protein